MKHSWGKVNGCGSPSRYCWILAGSRPARYSIASSPSIRDNPCATSSPISRRKSPDAAIVWSCTATESFPRFAPPRSLAHGFWNQLDYATVCVDASEMGQSLAVRGIWIPAPGQKDSLTPTDGSCNCLRSRDRRSRCIARAQDMGTTGGFGRGMHGRLP